MNMLARFNAIRLRLFTEVVTAGVLANGFVYVAYNTFTV